MRAQYQILDRIATTAGSDLHRARRCDDDAPVLLKLPKSGGNAPDASRFRREYAVMASLDVPGVLKPTALLDEPGTLMMVLRPAEGKPLEQLLSSWGRVAMLLFLRLGVQLARILGALHGAHIIHRDLRPANMLLLEGERICLADLSLATTDSGQDGDHDNLLIGDWAYVSPEQTGRLNGAVDFRTDFYSLGVTLYRMLTGLLPCQAGDALGWAHCHLASLPRSPSELDPAIPQAVSDIMLKLLEKKPEDRYQSAYGLQADLEECLAQWSASDAIRPFPLGSRDMSEQLQIPPMLAGREAEYGELLQRVDAVIDTGRPAIALVSGGAGVGKTALIHQLRRPIMERGAFFVSGKFDQYQRDIPYSTVTQAFRELVQQILANSEAGVENWRRKILDAVGANGQLIIDVLPQAELIIGRQPAVPQLPPAEAQNRFRTVFQKFISLFAQKGHPLTLFLDDLQWADAASLKLVRDLVTMPGRCYLLVIGAYRGDEAGTGDALHSVLGAMRAAGASMSNVTLGPLPEADLATFVGEMLHCEPDAVAPLAHLVHQKTGGNPLFMVQFLTALADEGLIAFDAAARSWRWDLAAISAKGYSDDVAELMIEKLARLPAAAREMLHLLACLGPGAGESTLVTLSGQPEQEARRALSAPIRAGLIACDQGTVSFLHDQVQEAVYQTMPEPARAALHLKIGRHLIDGKSPGQVAEAVFPIVDQFNRGASAIVDHTERALLFRLNLMAGKKAKAAVALASARGYLERALALSPAKAWQEQYEDFLELSLALAECEYLDGNFGHADQLADQILAHARSHQDSARVQLLRISLYQVAGRLNDAVASMAEGLRLFGIGFPSTEPETAAATDAEVDAISALLQGRRIADIVDAPRVADPDIATVLLLLVEGVPAAYMIRPDLFHLIIAMAVRLSLEHGNSEDSCFAFSAYGIVLISRRRDIPSALAFSAMALQLTDKLDARRRKGRVIATHAIAYSLLQDSVADARKMLDEAYAASLDVGDQLYASYISMIYLWQMLQQGVPLDEVLETVHRFVELALENHNEMVCQTLRFQQHFVLNLRGETFSPETMSDKDFDEAECLDTLEKAAFGFGLQSSYTTRQVAAFLHGDPAGALRAAEQVLLNSHAAHNLILVDAQYHFFYALTLAATYPKASAERQRELAAGLAVELEKHEWWAKQCPKNFSDRRALVAAEAARIEGRDQDAARLYEEAISAAYENGFGPNAAIAYELASCFYRASGYTMIADTYLREARDGYARWGATGKVAELDANYPQLRARDAQAAALAGGDVAQLDLLSVAKASQAISSQIVLADLVNTLMHIVLENAGAQRAYLLLAHADELALAAEASIDGTGTRVHLHLDQPGPPVPIAASVLNYVRRSREAVVLPDVSQPHPFSSDPYFAQQHPGSLLCLPILRKDTLVGMLYLENSLVAHAFAPERVAVLKLLASQAAISLENAGLYADVKEREARIRRLFEANIVGIMFYDIDGIREANDAALAMIGYSRQDLDGARVRWSDLLPPERSGAVERAIHELKTTGRCRAIETELVRKDGRRIPVLTAAARFEGSNQRGVSFILDLTERKRAEEHVRHMANHDVLTGLPNRTLLQDRLHQAVFYAHRTGGKVAVLFIDLDFFKYINDSLGHQIGDIVLEHTASRLNACLREGDTVARLGGDEFVIILPAVADSGTVAAVAQQVLETLAQPFTIVGHELHVSASIGISLYPDDGSDVDTLMRTADTAMYHAKEMGRGKFQFFTEALNQAAQQRLEVDMRLRHALARDEFVLYYQPQVDMESGRIFAAEALLRWSRPGSEPVSCGSFIGNAEESGLIVPIGEWILRQACGQLKTWREGGYPRLKMAVNLSPRQLEPEDFCAMVGRILDETGIPAEALELEITENILMQRSEVTLATLTTLRDMGVRLSVDDFGTGYSSLSYLQRFPVHALKIDQSFVQDIGTDRNHTALTTAIIAMANSLQLAVIAEGVESAHQARFLLENGCRSAQGFYYSRAVPAQAFSELLLATLPARGGLH